MQKRRETELQEYIYIYTCKVVDGDIDKLVLIEEANDGRYCNN